jgi:hypothetical protein
MGEDLTKYRVKFNGSIRIEDRDTELTPETGALLLRDFMERLRLPQWLEERLSDPRHPDLITHPQVELVMTLVMLFALGWRDQDDADRLRDDPLLRLASSKRRGLSPLKTRKAEPGQPLSHNPPEPEGLGSQPTMSRQVQALSTQENRKALRQSLLYVAAERNKARRQGHRLRYLTVDLDSLPVEVYGEQEGAEYNGHYHKTIYHPLLCSIGQTGDMLDTVLRHGKAHTAEGDLEFVLPLLDQVEQMICQVAALRIDAGFPDEAFLFGLEQRRTGYVARVKNNAVLDRLAEPYLKRPVGRPPTRLRTWFHELTYQAQSWSRARRVILVVVERAGQPELDYFWLITNWTVEQMSGPDLLAMYRKRGTAEGHQGELMDVLSPKLSSTTRAKAHYRGKPPQRSYPSGNPFAQNEVLWLLNVLAYNVAHGVRGLVEQASGRGMSLKTFREQVLRVAAQVLVHGRRVTVVLARRAVAWWQGVLAKLQPLRLWTAQGTS